MPLHDRLLLILKLFQFPRVVIRGELQDDAVLCTEKETFDLKLADTSNTMLLTPNTLLPEMPGIVRGAGISIIAGADIHIIVFTDCKNNRFQKKLIGQNTNI
jgi:hypothetical protein